MRRVSASKTIILLLSFMLFFSCRKDEHSTKITKSSESLFAGVVSHHILVSDYIDEWFSTLANENSKIKTFIILSPSHWGLSTGEFSLTLKDFEKMGEKIETDIKTEKKLLEKTGGKIEDTVFSFEHGITVLIPFIKKHFPKAKVAAVACNGGLTVSTRMAERLSGAISPFVGKKDFFILISSDFSHLRSPEETLKTDAVSMKFFENPSFETVPLVICDNRVSFFALAKNFPESTKSIILRNTNSFLETGQLPEETTSYFFAYFTFPKK